MAKDTLSIDYETYSDADLSEVGVSRYCKDPSTEILMAAYSLNGSEERQWIPAEGQKMPPELQEALFDPEVEKWAWNAPFEMAVTSALIRPVEVRQWRCSMVVALTCSLPGSLDAAAKALNLKHDSRKDAAGSRLMRKFSFPRKPTIRDPRTRILWHEDLEDWNDYLAYNRQDVKAERAVLRKLWKFRPPEHEWDLWALDQKINQAGLPINLNMVANAIRVYEDCVEDAIKEMKEITGLGNPMSVSQLVPWLREKGYPFRDAKKGHIKRAKERAYEAIEVSGNDFAVIHESKAYIRALELRQEVSRTSIKKYHALMRATDDDGNLRNVLQFAAAGRTWRWGGRLFQPQNLPRPEKRFEKRIEVHARNIEFLDAESLRGLYGNVFDVLASCIRPAAQAPEGYVFLDADLAAIENIVLGWLSNCEKILMVFERGLDPYLAFAVYLFNMNYRDLVAEYNSGMTGRRTISKPGVLGCGYMMGPGSRRFNDETGEWEAGGLLGYAWNMGVKQFTEEDARLSVDTFRREFTEVVDYWYGIERAAKKCITTGKPVEFGHITFDYYYPFMRIRLPSGRFLHYLKPKIEVVDTPWGDKKQQITYEGQDERKQWRRITTHPGKLTENVDQAIARDILANGLLEADRRGIDIRLHVHDQILGLAPEDRAEEALAVLNESMRNPPEWAKGMPLKTAGFTSKVFMKD
jgi:DNA polymerase